jgi:hypothetical protein
MGLSSMNYAISVTTGCTEFPNAVHSLCPYNFSSKWKHLAVKQMYNNSISCSSCKYEHSEGEGSILSHFL